MIPLARGKNPTMVKNPTMGKNPTMAEPSIWGKQQTWGQQLTGGQPPPQDGPSNILIGPPTTLYKNHYIGLPYLGIANLLCG